MIFVFFFFFFQAEDGIRDADVTGVQTCALPISLLIGLAVLAGTRRELYGRLFLKHRQIMGIGTAAVCVGSVNMLYYLGFMFWYQIIHNMALCLVSLLGVCYL